MLAISNGLDKHFDPSIYSIYSYERISELWVEGNPFAWHLFSESKMIYSSDKIDFIKSLGSPKEYQKFITDCDKFFKLFSKASTAINSGTSSAVFELSNIFLAIRNFATCFSLGKCGVNNFSRRSALQMGNRSLAISREAFEILERSRILCIRGTGKIIQKEEIRLITKEIESIGKWMQRLLMEVR